MRLTDILAADRVLVDVEGSIVRNKNDALRILSRMLAPAAGVEAATIETLLTEREALQSTGIGDGVAIPHTSLEAAPGQAAALIVCPHGIPFDAIDGKDVTIVFGVVGPRKATGEHLRVLARISRLLRDGPARQGLIRALTPAAALSLIEGQDGALR
ncbi:MAG: PTS sugar transporter subunit IIA [Polyangiaceae bacterium]|nr:PTS sugar transporter subunit IIA [Polyangiaceae bacterium]